MANEKTLDRRGKKRDYRVMVLASTVSRPKMYFGTMLTFRFTIAFAGSKILST